MFTKIKSTLQRIFKKNEPITGKHKLICQKCGKPIDVPTYVIVEGTIITNSNSPKIFTCPEHKFNYSQGIIVHTNCWIMMLKEYGTEVYDMAKVYEQYNQMQKKNKGGK